MPRVIFHAVVPGKQFSTTIALPVEHERLRGSAAAVWPVTDSAEPASARTAYTYGVPLSAVVSENVVSLNPVGVSRSSIAPGDVPR